MKIFHNKTNKASYFAEIQPIIRNRLMPILLILVVSFFVSTVIETIVGIIALKNGSPDIVRQIHWINSIIMLLASAGFAYAAFVLKKNHLRKAINLLLGIGTASIITLAFLTGGLIDPPLIIYPLLIMTAGFFGNVSIMKLIKWACFSSIVFMYVMSTWVFKPLGTMNNVGFAVFMRFDQMIYCLIIMEVGFRAVKMFINDYGTILSHLRKEQKALDFMANHDKLTGLPNRHSCETHFEKLFRDVPLNNNKTNFLLFIDIDNFKNINTRFGHNGGDEALVKVAKRLDKVFSCDNAIVCRIGGDEFIVMLRMSIKEAEMRFDSAIKTLATPLTIFDQTEHVTCSIGVVEVVSNSSLFKDEYRKADLAMNRAKKTGKNRYCYFNQGINDSEVKNIQIGARLHDALENDEFTLYYQPQVDLKSGKIIGAEALIRWITQSGQIIPPNDFIPVAEKNNSIIEMTYWVIRQACIDCATWHREGYTDMFVSVNIPSSVLSEGKLPELLKKECASVGLDPKYLELELTESVILENSDDMQQQLQDIRDMGISMAIDDFGTGYSNLSYLSRLNVQKLKVDQYFVMNLIKSEQDRTIVQAVAQIADSFGMKTVAEGVEKSEFIKSLSDLNCTIGQGYYWSKPEPLETFMKLLGSHENGGFKEAV